MQTTWTASLKSQWHKMLLILGLLGSRCSCQGLITLAALLTLLQFLRVLEADPRHDRRARLGLGFLCGIAVLARNDAVFLVTAIFLVWTIWDLFVRREGFVTMVRRLFVPGLLSIIVASPWLIHNAVFFGSIVHPSS